MDPLAFDRLIESMGGAFALPSEFEPGSAYGYCPQCQAPGNSRERRRGGNDTCANGHVYPSASALKHIPESLPVKVVERQVTETHWECPHCHEKIGEKDTYGEQREGLDEHGLPKYDWFHRGCGKPITLPPPSQSDLDALKYWSQGR